MKVKKFKSKQILKLYLLKSRMYERMVKKKGSNLLAESDLIQIVTYFKKALQVIFQYHSANKRILFIGVPKKLELQINKVTNHVAVSNIFNLQGVISNYSKNFVNKTIESQKSQGTLFKGFTPKLSKKPDLIVLFSHVKKSNIISESYVAKIPLIVFNNDLDSKKIPFSNFYDVQGNENNLMNMSNQNLFSVGLNFLFKTSTNGIKRNKKGLKPQKPFFKNVNRVKFTDNGKKHRNASF